MGNVLVVNPLRTVERNNGGYEGEKEKRERLHT